MPASARGAARRPAKVAGAARSSSRCRRIVPSPRSDRRVRALRFVLRQQRRRLRARAAAAACMAADVGGVRCGSSDECERANNVPRKRGRSTSGRSRSGSTQLVASGGVSRDCDPELAQDLDETPHFRTADLNSSAMWVPLTTMVAWSVSRRTNRARRSSVTVPSGTASRFGPLRAIRELSAGTSAIAKQMVQQAQSIFRGLCGQRSALRHSSGIIKRSTGFPPRT